MFVHFAPDELSVRLPLQLAGDGVQDGPHLRRVVALERVQPAGVAVRVRDDVNSEKLTHEGNTESDGHSGRMDGQRPTVAASERSAAAAAHCTVALERSDNVAPCSAVQCSAATVSAWVRVRDVSMSAVGD